MRHVELLSVTDPARNEAEDLISNSYGRFYGARITEFSRRLIASKSESGKISCVAGLRLAEDGFFSESYLRAPIETLLQDATGHEVERDEVFEVTTLASSRPHDLSEFIDDIIRFGVAHDLRWSFFTLTSRLSRFVRRRNLSLIPLAEADPCRISDPGCWGSYYATEPKVYGVCGDDMIRSARLEEGGVGHARVS